MVFALASGLPSIVVKKICLKWRLLQHLKAMFRRDNSSRIQSRSYGNRYFMLWVRTRVCICLFVCACACVCMHASVCASVWLRYLMFRVCYVRSPDSTCECRFSVLVVYLRKKPSQVANSSNEFSLNRRWNNVRASNVCPG